MKKFLLVFLTVLFLGVPIVTAQQLALSVSIPLLEITIKPGKSVLIAYTVGNNGDPTALRARILPFRPQKKQKKNIIKKNFFSRQILFFFFFFSFFFLGSKGFLACRGRSCAPRQGNMQ